MPSEEVELEGKVAGVDEEAAQLLKRGAGSNAGSGAGSGAGSNASDEVGERNVAMG